MGKITPNKPVKLIIGFIFKQNGILDKAKAILQARFGKIDFESAGLPFSLTDYYQEEFGSDLKRVFVSFKKLIRPVDIAAIKISTIKIEQRLSVGHKRLVNIDPGYLDLAKLVLASTKDYAHRIYLDKGIYAEITLSYQGKGFCACAWTYPDYRTDDYRNIFNQIRKIYAGQINNY